MLRMLLRLGSAAAGLYVFLLVQSYETKQQEIRMNQLGTGTLFGSALLLLLLGFRTVSADKHHPCGFILVPDPRTDAQLDHDYRHYADRAFNLLRALSLIFGLLSVAHEEMLWLGLSCVGIAITCLTNPRFSTLCWLYRIVLVCVTCWMILVSPIRSPSERRLVLAFCTLHTMLGCSLLRSRAEHFVELTYLISVGMMTTPTNRELTGITALVATIVLSLASRPSVHMGFWTSKHVGSVQPGGSDLSESATNFTKSSVKDKACSCTCECEDTASA